MMAQTQQIISHRVAGNFSATIHSFQVCTDGQVQIESPSRVGLYHTAAARDTFWVRGDDEDVTYLGCIATRTADPGEEL